MVRNDGFIINMLDSTFISYYKNFVIYTLPYTYSMQFQGKIINEYIKFEYFIYNKNELHGVKFKSLDDSIGVKITVDSIVKSKSYSDSKFFVHPGDSLVYKRTYSSGNEIIEKYVPEVKYDETYNDTSFYYYEDKLRNVDFSFSKQMDSAHQLKLVKIRFLYNPTYWEKYKLNVQQRELSFELNESKQIPDKDILNIVEKYEKIQQRNN